MPAKLYGPFREVLWVLSPSCGCPDVAFVSVNLLSEAVQGLLSAKEELFVHAPV